MSISAECQCCGKQYRLGEDRAGQKLACKACGELFQVPRSRDSQSSQRRPSPRKKKTAREPSDWDLHLRKAGIALIVLGLASFILPMVGLQLRMFVRLGGAAQIGGAIASMIGAAVFGFGMRQNLALAGGVSGGSAVLTLILLIVHMVSNGDGKQQDPKRAENRNVAQGNRPRGRPNMGGNRPIRKNQPVPNQGRKTPPNQNPPTKQPVGEPGRSGQVVNLLEAITPSRDQVLGVWSKQNGNLISPASRPARLTVPFQPP